jgi:hypothetical protein
MAATPKKTNANNSATFRGSPVKKQSVPSENNVNESTSNVVSLGLWKTTSEFDPNAEPSSLSTWKSIREMLRADPRQRWRGSCLARGTTDEGVGSDD